MSLVNEVREDDVSIYFGVGVCDDEPEIHELSGWSVVVEEGDLFPVKILQCC